MTHQPALAEIAQTDAATPADALAAARRKRAPKAKSPKAACDDCWFKRNMLCALDADKPCPTFRHHEQGLTPPQQLSFVFRQERTRSAWVFEQKS